MKQVLIVGGGSAGWLTALFAKKFLPNTEIKLIQDKKIGIIGVGEATTPHFVNFLNLLEINIDDFIYHTKGSIKHGISFENWNGDNKKYLHPFHCKNNASPFSFEPLFTHDCWLQYLIHLLDNNKKLTKEIYAYDLLYNNKIDLYNMFYALHFDATLMAEYLEKIGIERGIKVIKEKICSFNKDKNENIISVILENKKSYNCDFIFDCSGFNKLLIGKEYKAKWKSYSKNLPMKKTIIIPSEKQEYFPYTKSIAMKNGWIFEIPLQHRTGRGYIFDSDFINQNEALEEAEKFYNEKIEIKKVISFEAGVFEKIWIKNCMAVGLSSCFVEPLESTSLYVSVEQLREFMYYIQHIYSNDEKIKEKFNNYFLQSTDNILDFIYLHYITKRNDSKFWKNFKNNTKMPEGLLEKYEHLKSGHLVSSIFKKNCIGFDIESYIYVANGLGILKQSSNKLIGTLKPSIKEYNKLKINLLNNSIYHKQLLDNVKK